MYIISKNIKEIIKLFIPEIILIIKRKLLNQLKVSEELFDGYSQLFKNNLSSETIYGEYGCGQSTFYILKNFDIPVYSVDSSKQWVNKIKINNENNNNLSINYVNIGNVSKNSWGRPDDYSVRDNFINYANDIWNRELKPNLILIDGRLRVLCFLVSLKKCNSGTKIIFDDYVDIEYGTGCLKVTPAHDINDKSIGDRHDLQFIDIFNEDATLNDYGLHHKGKDRFKARKDIIIELDKLGILDKKEEIIHNVGISERTNEIIEPKFSHQWFLKMDDLVKPAINSVLVDNEIKLYPNKFDKTFRNWMENIRDWNISRQLYWGHQIPAYFYGNEKNDFVVAKDINSAIDLAKEKSGNKNLTKDNLRQEEDVLDTWFSSWLWPISVFDGINNPENEDFKYYYPTSDLVTGPDILFFWVSRMIMAGYEFKKEKPFKNVYFTGIVRDKQRRKMSKSLGNSPDALKLISEYGADSVRVGLMLSSSAGNDLLFDESLCSQGRSFANKIWNSYRLIDGWDIKNIDQPEYCSVALNWYENKFQLILSQIDDHFDKFRISDALMCVYKLIWDDFCSVLLEILKPEFSKPIDKKTHESLIMIFENNLKLLHPFMPFISEELWQSISERKVDQALVISKWPIVAEFDTAIIEDFKFISDVITSVRALRKKYSISFKESIELSVLNKENITEKYDSIIVKLCNISSLLYVNSEVNDAVSFRVKTNTYYVPLSNEVNIEDEILKLENELSYNIGFLNSVDKKLSNKKFVKNAPEKVIDIEMKKKSDAMAKIDLLRQSIKKLRS